MTSLSKDKNLDVKTQEEISVKTRDFSELLDRISSLDDKKKRLWLEIYENAISDRQNAYECYKTLTNICGENSSEYALHGRTISSYLERVSKANDQLIKLAELVSRAQEEDEAVDVSDIYTQIKDNG